MGSGSKGLAFRLRASGLFLEFLISTIDATVVKTNKKLQSLCYAFVIRIDKMSFHELSFFSATVLDGLESHKLFCKSH
jgi:hypothetical protein